MELFCALRVKHILVLHGKIEFGGVPGGIQSILTTVG